MGWVSKFIIFLMAFVVLTFWLRSLLFRRFSRQKNVTGQRDWMRTQQVSKEAMMCCAYCGTYVPKNAVVYGLQGGYCCTEHRNLGEKV